MDIARVLKNCGCFVHIVDDDAHDAEFTGLSQGKGPQVHLVLSQNTGQAVQGSRLIFHKMEICLMLMANPP